MSFLYGLSQSRLSHGTIFQAQKAIIIQFNLIFPAIVQLISCKALESLLESSGTEIVYDNLFTTFQ